MSAIWNVSKALQIPLDKKLTRLNEVPYTISYVIRKRQQIDSFNELPKEKRPPESIVWDGTSDDLDDWFNKVFNRKNNQDDRDIIFDAEEVE